MQAETLFVFKDTRLRGNPDAPCPGYSKTPRELLEEITISEKPDDFSDETYTRDECDYAPYVVYTKKSDAQLLQLRISKLKQIRDELTEYGGCLVQGKWFHTDVKSKQQQMALAMAGVNLPANLMWKTLDGSFVAMTPELAQELFGAQMTREATIFGVCEAKRSDDTPISEGWPERYIEAGAP